MSRRGATRPLATRGGPDRHVPRPGRPRTEGGDLGAPPLVPMTDFAANVFTVFFLLLIAVLAAVAASGQSGTDTVSAPPMHRRPPAASDRIVEALHNRQRRGPGAVIEVRSAGIRLIRPSGSTDLASGSAPYAEIRAAIAALGAETGPENRSEPTLVLVFAPGPIAAVEAGLAGSPYLDLSVPAALRGCAAGASPRRAGGPADCAVTEDWAPGFLALEGRDLDRTAFRAELAALLAAGAGRTIVAARPSDPEVSPATGAMSRAPVLSLIALPLAGVAAIELAAAWRGRRRRSVQNMTGSP